MNNVMLDLETMGISSNAAIVSIGAVEFDFCQSTIGESFYIAINLESSVKNGGIIDAETVLWWINANEEARSQFKENGAHISLALQKFSDWLSTLCEKSELKMWGNGSAFDNVILSNAYKNLGLETPWHFWNDRCYKTIKSFRPEIEILRRGVHHNALDDAISQAEHILKIMELGKIT